MRKKTAAKGLEPVTVEGFYFKMGLNLQKSRGGAEVEQRFERRWSRGGAML